MSKIETLRIADLKPYEKNPRENDEAVAAVVASIKQFGFVGAIVVNKDYVVINGHTRIKAMKQIGADTIPAIVVDHLTPEQERALRIADNKTGEIAQWDMELLKAELNALQEAGFDMGAMGFDTSELEDLLGGTADELGATDPDEIPEAPEVALSKPGELYILGEHRLLCGDSTKAEDVARVCPDGTADCWLTDPPYNVAYEGSNGLTIKNDSMEDSKFREFLRTAFHGAEKAMKPGAAFYIFHADSEGYNFRGACFDVGLRVRECLVWKKQSLVLGRQDYQWVHEPCQPAGTMVRMADGTEKPIEQLRDGDRVVAFDPQTQTIKNIEGGVPVFAAYRFYHGRLFGIRVRDKITWATDTHRFTIRTNGKVDTVLARDICPDGTQVPVVHEDANGSLTLEWQTIDAVETKEHEGLVFSLDVEKYEHYIADGIVTHNCLYGWKEGASHNWYGDRSQTTVMEFNKPKKNNVHPCLAPETRVMTPGGLKMICEITLGEKVLSCDGRFHRVHLVSSHPYHEKIYAICTDGQLEPDMATHNHKYLVATKRGNNIKNGYDVHWVRAENLKVGDLLMTPKMRDGAYAPVSELDAYCYGLWLSQGAINRSCDKERTCPSFFFDSGKTDLVDKLVAWSGDKGCGIYPMDSHGCKVVVFDMAKAKECIRYCSNEGKEKHISDDVFAWKESLRCAFLNGYVDGDGWRSTKGDEIRIKTSSLLIATQLVTLAFSVGGHPVVHHRKAADGTAGWRKGKDNLEYYEISLRPADEMETIKYAGTEHRLSRVKSICARQYNGDVWNLGVEGTHTFQTANGMTKNTMKPVEMLVYLLKNSTKRGDVVIDSFGGSGSTLIACQQTGRVCRTIELDPKYCDVIRRRWAEHVHGEGCDWEHLTPVEECTSGALKSDEET